MSKPTRASIIIREGRKRAGLTQQELADKLGITTGAVSNYENGVSSPKEEVLLRLFDALQIDPNYLYRDSFRAGSFVCSHEEQALIEAYRALPPLGREAVRSLIDSLGALCRAQEESVP